jgi:hypothetical protein
VRSSEFNIAWDGRMKRQGISVSEDKIAEFIPTLSKMHRVGKKIIAKN